VSASQAKKESDKIKTRCEASHLVFILRIDYIYPHLIQNYTTAEKTSLVIFSPNAKIIQPAIKLKEKIHDKQKIGLV